MTPRGYTIRLAIPDDIPALPAIERSAATLFEACLRETGLTAQVLARTTPQEDLEEARQAGRLWVAQAPAGDPVGFALVQRMAGFAHLAELDVLPSHGRQGVGSALLAAVCSWAAGHAFPAVTLRTFRDVAWNAPFYERRGFGIVDSAALSPMHVALDASEQQRGLSIERRVSMVRLTTDAARRIVDLVSNDRLVEPTAQLLLDVFRNRTEDWQDLESARQEVLASLEPDRISRVVVDESGGVLGWIGGIPTYGGRVWEIHPLVVIGSHRRHGIGRALVQDLERLAAGQGALTLWAGADDEHGETTLSGTDLYPDIPGAMASIRNTGHHPYEFYLRVGFRIAGVLPDANGPGKPDIFLAKRVGNRVAEAR